MQASFQKHRLQFKNPAGTSRGVLRMKETWFIKITDNNGRWGVGECALFRGLSADDRTGYEEKLQWVCHNIHLGKEKLLAELAEFPSIQFGLETAFHSFYANNPFVLFPSEFTTGKSCIAINGLIWMGEKSFMLRQIKDKLEAGFQCVKLKIGALDFDAELSLLKHIRQEFSAEEIEIRVDANGAFSPQKALEKLKRLSDFELHSIEQPIRQGQWKEMAALCSQTPLPIALDEELIGVFSVTKKQELIQTIQPQYIILKPALVGGFRGSEEWIDLAENNAMGWWATSALESNVGLNAIAQWVFTKKPTIPQGLGTGSLFTNNIASALALKGENLCYDPDWEWNREFF